MSTKGNNILRIIRPEWLFAVTFTVLLLPNVCLSITEPMGPAARICNILLPAGIYLLLLSFIRNPGKSVWALFFLLFLSAFQLVLLYLYGHSIIAVDMFLNLVTTNATEVGELLGGMLPAVIGVAIVFLPILYIAIISARDKKYILQESTLRFTRRCGLACTLSGVISMGISYFDREYAAEDSLYPANVCYNLYLAIDRSVKTAKYAETCRDFRFDAHTTHPDSTGREIYILVIGETARADNFSLYGYRRETTPHLSTDTGLIKYTHAYTQSNTTHKSVPMLMSAAHADDYDRIYREKSIITAFHEAGFHTSFISNQRHNHSFIDLFGEEADLCKFLKEETNDSKEIYDNALLDVVDDIIASGNRREFIVLHTYGSHFKYRDRYPQEMAYFMPEHADEVTASNREELLNAYDNTIRYTDNFLHTLISHLRNDSIHAGMLYTSDHGENIFDDSRGLFLHASPRPSAYELHVPLIVWLSDSYQKDFPEVANTLSSHSSDHVITSASVFHTMLDIGGLSTPIHNDSLSLASNTFEPIPYTYLSDRNIAMPIDKIMLH